MTTSSANIRGIIRLYAELRPDGRPRYCEHIGKVIYPSEAAARRAARLMHHELPLSDPQHVYFCRPSGDHYHLTRMKQGREP